MPRPHEATLDLPQVHKPPMEPGSILFFHSILHGTTAWLSPWERRTVVQFYCKIVTLSQIETICCPSR